jgi:hypothetical protein
MKSFRIQSLILAVSLTALSCSPAVKTLSAGQSQRDSLSIFQPLGSPAERLLLKAGIDVRGRHFSGIVLIKPMPETGSFRVLFLSELGLNLLDMACENGVFTVVSVQEFLNRPAVLKALQDDFHTLLLDLSSVRNPTMTWRQEEGMQSGILRFREGMHRYRYDYEEFTGALLVIRKKGCFGGTEIRIDRHEGMRVCIKHRGSPVHIEMTELKQTEEQRDE